jgi:hypothetical protein
MRTLSRPAGTNGIGARLLAGNARVALPSALAAVLVAGLYLSTLMLNVSGCSSEYCADTGEFQVALASWGTVHYTGYPFYMLLGSPFVTIVRAIGIAPAAGASLYSLVWEVGAVAGLSIILTHMTRNAWLGTAGGVLFGVFEPIWVHGSIAEVYSLSMALTIILIGLTIYLGRHWSDRVGWLLAFVAGLGVAHHRLVAVSLPAIGVYLLPNAWRGGRFGRWLAVAVLCFMLGFVPYVDMPVRVWLGSTWNFGHPGTWSGFWDIFWSKEVFGQEQPSLDPAMLLSAGQDVAGSLSNLMTLPGLVVALVAAGLSLIPRATRALAAMLWGILLSNLAFALVFRKAVLLEVDLMAVLLLFVLLGALSLMLAGPTTRTIVFASVVLWAAWLVGQNFGFVAGLARNPASVALIQQVSQLDAPPGAVVMEPWGRRYFALSYAQRFDDRFADWTIVDHRADLATLAARTGGIYADASTPFVFNIDWWTQRLGSPLRVTSAGPGLIELTSRPLPSPTHPAVPVGDGIGLESCELRFSQADQQLRVVLYWIAQRPVHTDYSTYVYASDQDDILKPDDLLAQDDSASAVDGWYPTTNWQPSEVVREDHLLQLPAGRSLRTLFAGMYTRDAAGHFVQLGRLRLSHAVAGNCVPER